MNSKPRWLVPVVAVVGSVLVLVLLGALSLTRSYNSLVDKDETVNEAFADLEGELQRRVDLIPNVVRTAQAALEQEQEIFGELARARANYAGAESEGERLEAGGQVESALGRLLVIVENYPTLQSNQNLLAVQDQLEGSENRVAQARRVYNEVTTEYNRSVRRFPRSLVAGIFGFDRRPLFEIEDPADREAPVVDFGNGDDPPADG